MKFMWICMGMMMYERSDLNHSVKQRETPISETSEESKWVRSDFTASQWILQLQLRIIRYYTCQNWLLFVLEREKETSCDSRTHSLFYADISMCCAQHNESANQPVSKSFHAARRKMETKFTICNLKSCTFHRVWNILFCTLQYRLQQQHKTRYKSAAWFVAITLFSLARALSFSLKSIRKTVHTRKVHRENKMRCALTLTCRV